MTHFRFFSERVAHRIGGKDELMRARPKTGKVVSRGFCADTCGG